MVDPTLRGDLFRSTPRSTPRGGRLKIFAAQHRLQQLSHIMLLLNSNMANHIVVEERPPPAGPDQREANGGTNASADRVAFAITDCLAYFVAVLGTVLVADT